MEKPLTAQEKYERTLSWIEKFKAAVKKHDEIECPPDVHWKIYRAVKDGLISQLESLQDEAFLYEKEHGL